MDQAEPCFALFSLGLVENCGLSSIRSQSSSTSSGLKMLVWAHEPTWAGQKYTKWTRSINFLNPFKNFEIKSGGTSPHKPTSQLPTQDTRPKSTQLTLHFHTQHAQFITETKSEGACSFIWEACSELMSVFYVGLFLNGRKIFHLLATNVGLNMSPTVDKPCILCHSLAS